jgi:hypothetical protein
MLADLPTQTVPPPAAGNGNLGVYGQPTSPTSLLGEARGLPETGAGRPSSRRGGQRITPWAVNLETCGQEGPGERWPPPGRSSASIAPLVRHR